MPLGIQQADASSYLRWFHDLRGRIPLALDETVVPVVQIGDMDVPGVTYPRQGEWTCAQGSQTGAAVQTAKVAFGPTDPETFFVAHACEITVSTNSFVNLFKIVASSFTVLTQARSSLVERNFIVDNGGLGSAQESSPATGASPSYLIQGEVAGAGTKYRPLPPFVIRFGELLMFEQNTVTLNLFVSLFGRLYSNRGIVA